MRTIASLAGRLLALPVAIASAALFGLMVITFLDVIMRSVFDAPIQAATELIRIAIAIIVFSALPLLAARDEHISVDLLDGAFRRFNLARWRDGIITLVCGVILYFPAERVTVLAERARGYGDTTEYLSIPTFYVGWFIAIMTFATAAVMVIRGLIILIAPHYLTNIQK
jgi:TRAP-type C4-dicarboxylate transport system permease small subunit